MNNLIPIENIYYLLCYSWNKLDEKEIVNVNASGSIDVLNLFARILTAGLKHLFKRGFDREYVLYQLDIRGIKGKLNFQESIKRNLFCHTYANCEFDELDYNVLHNRLLKSTVNLLLRVKDLEEEYKDELLRIYNCRFHDIDLIELNDKVFSRVRLNRNNYFYDFLLKICQLIVDNILIDEKTGESKFRDFLQDEVKMRHVFEEFLRNFYRFEQSDFKVSREIIYWNIETFDDYAYKYLPEMKTDITLESKERKIIIDAKYYKNTLDTNYGKDIIRSTNLYQISEYLRNIEVSGGINQNCEGILIYPTVNKEVDLKYNLADHIIKIKTINLNQNWRNIHQNLLSFLN